MHIIPLKEFKLRCQYFRKLHGYWWIVTNPNGFGYKGKNNFLNQNDLFILNISTIQNDVEGHLHSNETNITDHVCSKARPLLQRFEDFTPEQNEEFFGVLLGFKEKFKKFEVAHFDNSIWVRPLAATKGSVKVFGIAENEEYRFSPGITPRDGRKIYKWLKENHVDFYRLCARGAGVPVNESISEKIKSLII